MTGIATVDLAQFRIDEESFLGQTLSLGVQYRKLPEHAGDAMRSYLRAQSMSHAARTRHGIALSKGDLERSVRQAMVCLEIGLREAAEGDLNRAVDCLAEGDFEALRQRGYQTAFKRLEEMKGVAAALAEAIPGGLLRVERTELEELGQLVPETWIRPAQDEDDEVALVDPLKDVERFRLLRSRAEFLVALPEALLQELDDAAGDEGAWDAFLRNLVLALALDLETLVPESGDVARFESDCFEDGAMRDEVREKVVGQVAERLNALDFDPETAAVLREDVENEIVRLESAAGIGMEGFFLMADDE